MERHKYEQGKKKKEYLEPYICPNCMGHGCTPGDHDYNSPQMCKECKGNGIKWG